jgi:ADP-ribose pyrophosphatase
MNADRNERNQAVPPQRKILFESRIFRVVRVSNPEAPGGGNTRDIVEHPGAVTILPLVDDDNVCLIHNDRVAAGKTLIELPAGTIDPGEDPSETAARELVEETGYRAGRIERLSEFFTSPGIMSERMYLFLATDLTPGPMALEGGEQIKPFVVPWSEAVRMALDGEIEDGKSLVGIMLYDRLRADGQRQRDNGLR